MEEQLKEDQQELETREKKKKVEDVQRIRRMVHESDKSKRLSHMQNEMGRLMHHDEQELLSVWKVWHWDDNNGGWLDPELCAKPRREEVEYTRRHKMYTRVSWEVCLSRQDGRTLTRGSQESPMCVRNRSRRSIRHTRDQSCTRRRRRWRR